MLKQKNTGMLVTRLSNFLQFITKTPPFHNENSALFQTYPDELIMTTVHTLHFSSKTHDFQDHCCHAHNPKK